MKILWVCNIVLNDFTEEYGIKKQPFGGWMEGLLHELEKDPSVDIGLCFPIIDKDRMKNSSHNNHKYFSYSAKNDSIPYKKNMLEEFKSIIQDFQPDVIHIWGTEYNHARSAMEAACILGFQNRVLVRIQGLVHIYALHYTLGTPEKYLLMKSDQTNDIRDGLRIFQERGENEKKVLEMTRHVCDRADWGEFCAKQINPEVNYYNMDNILWQAFYKASPWNLESCKKHEIFVSQASYPVKGLHFLLRAAGILKRKYMDVSIRIAGNNILEKGNFHSTGEYARYLVDLIEEYHLQDNVKYVGRLDADGMVREYQQAHVSVCPSTIENRANSICEAMMIGTPVIASYVGGNIGTIENGIDGYLYPADEFYMLAGYIDRIFSDDELAMCISRMGRRTALNRHNPEKIRARAMEIYQSVVKTNVESCSSENL